MQNNDFEKQVKQQLQEFSLPPADSVWKKVEARVQKEKQRRRVLFFWMFAGILLVGGGAGILLVSKTGPGNISSTYEKNNEPIAGNGQSVKSVNDEIESSNTTTKVTDQNNKAERTDNKGQEDEVLKERKSSIVFKKSTSKTRERKTSLIVKEPRIKSTTENNSAVLNKEQIEIDKTESKQVEESHKENITAKGISEEEIPTKIQSKPTPVALEESNVLPVKKSPKKNHKGWKWGATILTGLSDNVSPDFLPGNKSADRFVQNSNNPATGQSPQPIFNDTRGYNYGSSFSIGAGIFAEKKLTRKLSISAGFNYQLISSSIAVGNRVDSFKTIYDSAMMKTSDASNFYRAGESEKHRNNYHVLQFPLNVLFQLNKNAERPITLSAGLTPGVLIGSRALYFNHKDQIYYEENDHFKTLMLSTQAGLNLTIINQQKFQIQAGPHVQYQLSNLTKPIINTGEHLLFYGIKTNILFKKNK